MLLWKTEYGHADINNIKVVEEKLNIQFPEDYLNVVRLYQGGVPSKKNIMINDFEIVFCCLLTFLAFDELDLLDAYNEVRRFLHVDRATPFALDENNNYLCFDYQSKVDPSIIYVNRINGSKVKIANNFVNFMEMLN